MLDANLAVLIGGLVLLLGLAVAVELESKGLAALGLGFGAILAGGGLRKAERAA